VCGYTRGTFDLRRATNRSRWRQRGPEIVAGVLVATLVGIAVALLADAPRAAALVCVALLASALVALLGWRGARSRAAHAEAVAVQVRETQRDERTRLERHVRRLEGEREREAQLLQRVRRSWQAEREWSRELRAQIQRMQPAHATHADGGDVKGLILKAAIGLVEAEKGLLISREDVDGDGALDVVLSHGFEHDPAESAIAQRFARAVLAQDEILREDNPRRAGDAEATAADREIETLVAIPLYLRDRFYGVIVCANRPGGFEEVGDELLLALGDHAGAALHHDRLEHELRDAQRSAVRVLTEAVAAHDPVLHRETCELAVHAGLLAKELGFDDRRRDVVIAATLLRTVGYLALPTRPWLCAGPLTAHERSLVELHPRLGFNVLIQAPALHDVAGVVLYHHERFDGTGYPAGLSGQDIPLAARVLAVLEAYGAMTHERPYREPWSPEPACKALIDAAGTQFDPEVAELFVEQIRRAPRLVHEDVSEAVLDAMPLETADLLAPAVDGATLLGNHQRLQQDATAAAQHYSPFGVVVLELEDLPRVNAEEGHVAGDLLIKQAARHARRAAARLGGTAYRASGRRLGILIPAHERNLTSDLLDHVHAEFLAGPAIRAAISTWSPGEDGATVLARARDALRRDRV
jgi:HD-GYP domain-containing protein (c-di-GMP phosphodiesterase class II)/GGDEF domain-containing protein